MKIFFAIILAFHLQICICQEEPPAEDVVLDLPEGDESEAIVVLPNGIVEGTQDFSEEGRPFFSFKGIPYAKPPIGELRFQDPVAADPWTETLNATSDPSECPQIPLYTMLTGKGGEVVGDEDCLFLNVFTPQLNESLNGLPVMVFIHGGGFTEGTASTYFPIHFMNKYIVLVIIQYRLGILGFLSTEDDVMPGNLGLKDQTLALKWVQENIAFFGGDPNIVTIFGESAGSASVHYHMISPYSENLFRRVILQSGTAYCPWAITHKAKEGASIVAEKLNCSRQDSQTFLNCLKEKPVEEIVRLTLKLTDWLNNNIHLAPRVDGDYIPEDPETFLKKKDFSHIDFMGGTMRDEGALITMFIFSNLHLTHTTQSNLTRNAPYLLYLQNERNSEDIAKYVFQSYLQEFSFRKEKEEKLNYMLTDSMFKVCQDLASIHHVKNNLQGNTFLYQVNHASDISFQKLYYPEEPKKYAAHADELEYQFSLFNVFLNQSISEPQDLKVRKTMIDTWTNFAITGNPNPSENTEYSWLPATANNLDYFSIEPNPKMRPDYAQQIRNFWFSLPTRQNALLFTFNESALDIMRSRIKSANSQNKYKYIILPVYYLPVLQYG